MHVGRGRASGRYEPAPTTEDLCIAAREPDIPRVRALLQAGVDPNGENRFGEPILLLVLGDSSGFYDATPLLVEHGAKINCADQWGKTPLMYAVLYVDAATVDLLVKHGATINARDKAGHTALYMARHGSIAPPEDRKRMEQILVAHGAKE